MVNSKRRRPTIVEAGPDEIDVHVGQKVREARVLFGISQTALADKIGVSFQAVQKYEKGNIRLSASILVRIAVALEHPPAYFFQGLSAKGVPVSDDAPPFSRQLLDVVRAYQRLPEDLRLLLLHVMRGCARDRGADAAPEKSGIE